MSEHGVELGNCVWGMPLERQLTLEDLARQEGVALPQRSETGGQLDLFRELKTLQKLADIALKVPAPETALI